MAVTRIQSDILGLLAPSRRARKESYVARGVALNAVLDAPRKSRDIGLFHDAEEALARTWAVDRALLTGNGFGLDVLREAPGFVEARVTRGDERSVIQWARDNAYRFFPLIEDERVGLALHPFDLATNKILAMAGRLEVRDWVDVLTCDARLQPLGYLIWAACGKDPGYNPESLLAAASRSHYSQSELDALDYDGPRPDARDCGRRWHSMLAVARGIVDALPAAEIGKCVADAKGDLFRGTPDGVSAALRDGNLRFHEGTIGGAWPRFTA
jgi:hypothetical protein